MEIHVTRAQFHWESSDRPISLNAWLAYVEESGDLELSTAKTTSPINGQRIEMVSNGMARWTGGGYLDWRNGKISTRFSQIAVTRMIEVADHFQGNVQTDEGERLSNDSGLSATPASEVVTPETTLVSDPSVGSTNSMESDCFGATFGLNHRLLISDAVRFAKEFGIDDNAAVKLYTRRGGSLKRFASLFFTPTTNNHSFSATFLPIRSCTRIFCAGARPIIERVWW